MKTMALITVSSLFTDYEVFDYSECESGDSDLSGDDCVTSGMATSVDCVKVDPEIKLETVSLGSGK